MYSEAIQKMIDNKEVEPIYENQFQMADPNRQINYIPHFGVFRLDKATTKCRPVFDNSSTNEDGISLNQQLLKGPKNPKFNKRDADAYKAESYCIEW